MLNLWLWATYGAGGRKGIFFFSSLTCSLGRDDNTTHLEPQHLRGWGRGGWVWSQNRLHSDSLLIKKQINEVQGGRDLHCFVLNQAHDQCSTYCIFSKTCQDFKKKKPIICFICVANGLWQKTFLLLFWRCLRGLTCNSPMLTSCLILLSVEMTGVDRNKWLGSFAVVCVVVFETRSHIVQASWPRTMQRMAENALELRSSYIRLPRAEMTGGHHHPWFAKLFIFQTIWAVLQAISNDFTSS